jgi:hypothetical protein
MKMDNNTLYTKESLSRLSSEIFATTSRRRAVSACMCAAAPYETDQQHVDEAHAQKTVEIAGKNSWTSFTCFCSCTTVSNLGSGDLKDEQSILVNNLYS